MQSNEHQGRPWLQKLRTFVRHQSLQRGSWVRIYEATCDAASGSTIFDDPIKGNFEIGGGGGKTANAGGHNAFQDFKLLPVSTQCRGNRDYTGQVHENLFRYTMLKPAIISLHNAEASNNLTKAVAYARPLRRDRL